MTVDSPERQCTSCREKFPRSTMIRILKDYKSGNYIAEPDEKTFGRSSYICKSQRCLERALKNKRYQGIKEKLEKVINN